MSDLSLCTTCCENEAEWPVTDDQGERWATGGPILWLWAAAVVVVLGVAAWTAWRWW